MANENINTSDIIEKKEKKSFSEQIKNLKYAIIITL